MSEVLSHTLSSPENPRNVLIAEFSGLGISEDPGERIKQLSDIHAEGILDIAARVHEIVAPESVHTPYDKVMNIQSPDGSSKRELMQPDERLTHFEHAAELVKKLSMMDAPDNNTKSLILNRTANVLALALVQAHTFEDGNGRTARSVAQIVREGVGAEGSEAQDDLLFVSANRPKSGFRVNSFLPIKEGATITPEEVLERAAALDIPLSDTEAYIEQKHRTFMSPSLD